MHKYFSHEEWVKCMAGAEAAATEHFGVFFVCAFVEVKKPWKKKNIKKIVCIKYHF